jgi:transposase
VRDVEVFEQALGLKRPWYVQSVEFDVERGRLDVSLEFERGGRFECPECDRSGCRAYDTSAKQWRHLNFFEHETVLHARVPRVECRQCGVKQVRVPWARPGSGFTLLFEALVMAMVKQMPVRAVADLVGETDKRLWRILEHYVEAGRRRADHSQVRQVGVDETASKRGQSYVSFFVDLERRRLLFATEGREGDTLGRFRLDLLAHGGSPDRVKELCMDMSAAFQAGARKHFPRASITFDRFHVVKLFNEAIEAVRRAEQRERKELKRTRWLWVKRPDNLTKKQAAELAPLLEPNENALKTATAYRIKLSFMEEFWERPPALAEVFLKKWCRWAKDQGLEPMRKLADTLWAHREGLLRWYWTHISNGILEGLNSLVQAAKARARGYRTTKNLIAMAYLIGGDLDYQLPM